MTSNKDILKQFGLENDEELKRFIDEVDTLNIPASKTSKDEAWQKLEQSIVVSETSKKISKSFPIRTVLLAAASIAIIIGFGIGFNKWNQNNFSTTAGKMMAISLPDGSSVNLNASSSINWKSFQWKSSRKVFLNGEALFKVKKGSRFEVISNGNTVSVMGTEFNVNARNNYFEVKCYSGKVAVNIKGESVVILEKGQAVKKESQTKPIEQFQLNSNDSANWTNGEFFYNNASIQLVFDEIARQFNVHVQYPTEDRRYSGFFKNTSLDSALLNVCMPMGLKYNISTDSVVIR